MAGWRQLRAAAPAAVWPYAALTVVYLLSVLRVVGWAGLTDPAALYWHDWQDQSLYVRSATALATGDLAPSQHYYPLLYPLLGLPFLQLWPSQPFFLVNLACYLLAFGGFRSVARSFGVPLWGAVLLFAATTLAQFDIAKVWIEPWTSTPAAALLWLALGAMAQLWEEASSSRSLFTLPRPLLLPRRGPGPSREPVIGSDSASLRSTPQLGPGLRRGSVEEKRAQGGSRSPASILGLALGLIPFARPGDVIIGAIIALAATAALIRARDGRAARYAATSFFLSFGALATLFVAIYGFGPSPYMLYSAQYGFNFSWLGCELSRPSLEPGLVLARDAEQLADHRDWQGVGEIVDQIEVGPVPQPVEEGVGELLRLTVHRPHASRCELAHDLPAQEVVVWRIAEDEGTMARGDPAADRAHEQIAQWMPGPAE